MTETMICARGISVRYGDIWALSEVDLEVARGHVTALLGHNGAGKTTLVEVLSTLVPATRGTAEVAGFDVARRPAKVRRRIGLTGQYAALDDHLTGVQNLQLVARLLGASPREGRARAEELLALFGLEEAADRPSSTYSGGMRRRLDLAVALVGQPDVVFLDEPTTGLDPVSRRDLWDIVRRMVAAGTAVLLTTQYLDEADHLADDVVVLSRGRVVARGAPDDLKARVGARSVHLQMAQDDGPAAVEVLRRAGVQACSDDGRTISAQVQGPRDLAVVVRALDDAGLEALTLELTRPSLDDVYLALAGRGLPAGADHGSAA